MTCQGWWQQPNRLTPDLSHHKPSITRGDQSQGCVAKRGQRKQAQPRSKANPNMEHYINTTTRTQYHVSSVPRR